MSNNEKKLIELQVKLNFYKKLEKKIESISKEKIHFKAWIGEVREKNKKFEKKIKDLEFDINCPYVFMEWANWFFNTVDHNMDPKYLNNYFSTQMAFEEFKQATNENEWSMTDFKKAIESYCKIKKYTLNPKGLQNKTGRIIRKIDNKTQLAFYVQTKTIHP